MRILMVSMNSIHFVRWTQQLENSGHEVFWFDILDGGKTKHLPWVHQITGWKQKYPNFKGRYFFKNWFPFLYKKLSFLFENNIENVFENVLLDVKPDVVHSFALQISCLPILATMQKYNHTKWIYSSWGSDLFYSEFLEIKKALKISCLKRVNFLITDCKRDFDISIKYGFNGRFLGVLPGNGGVEFNREQIEFYIDKRKIILIKGYNDSIGKGSNIIRAFNDELLKLIKDYKIIIFGADKEIENFIKQNNVFKNMEYELIIKPDFIPNDVLLQIMGKTYLYIGNSISDGLPNTLLEAMGMGAFPIQSNPGNVTSEVISHGENGLLINNPDDINEITRLLKLALNDKKMVQNALNKNVVTINNRYSREKLKLKILKIYAH